MFKHDLANEEAEEQVDGCELSFLSELQSSQPPADDVVFVDFLLFPAVKSELRNVASRPPGEIGCFTFLRLPYIFKALDFDLIISSSLFDGSLVIAE